MSNVRPPRSPAAARRHSAPARRQLTTLAACIAIAFASCESSVAFGRTPHTLAPAVVEKWNRALHDPRLRNTSLMDTDQRRALAEEYGLESLLKPSPQGTTIFVTNCADSGAGSLRDAIGNSQSGGTVDLTQLACSSITVGSGALAVNQDDLTLIGPGRDRLTIGGKYTDRIFNHAGTGTLTIAGMSVGGGAFSAAEHAYGGCIYSRGSIALGNILYANVPSTGVDVEGCVVSVTGTSHPAAGGGVYSKGLLSLTNARISTSQAKAEDTSRSGRGGGTYSYGISMKYSEVSGNAALGASAGGGGMVVLTNASMLIESSTIADNLSEGSSGGIQISEYYGGDIKVSNSTISGNTAQSVGGMLIIHSNVNNEASITNSTITNNVSTGYDSGAGLYVFGNLYLNSTIIFGNFRGSNVPNDFASYAGTTVVYGGDNLVGVSASQLPPDTRFGADPLLGPLQNNGGATRTHLLRAGSPAISGGDNYNDVTNDQRGAGFPRTIGGFTDIGATEFDPDRIFNNGFD